MSMDPSDNIGATLVQAEDLEREAERIAVITRGMVEKYAKEILNGFFFGLRMKTARPRESG